MREGNFHDLCIRGNQTIFYDIDEKCKCQAPLGLTQRWEAGWWFPMAVGVSAEPNDSDESDPCGP